MDREHVKKIAIQQVAEKGLINLYRRTLCEAAGVKDGSFVLVMGCTFTEFVAELKAEGVGQGQTPRVSKRRANPALRKEQILAEAVEAARIFGYPQITRTHIAERAGVSVSLVTRYLGSMGELRRSVMRQAVRLGVVEVIAQGLATCDPHARKASPELKRAAAAYLNDQ